MQHDDKTDQWLQQAKNLLREETAPPRMWQNITAELERPLKIPADWLEYFRRWRIPALASVSLAAVLVVGILLFRPAEELITPEQARTYALEIDKRVYKAQKQYERQIADLERQVDQLDISVIDNRWQSNFEKVLALDLLINECKTTLKYNPYNPTIHEHLVAGYRLKIDNLNTILTVIEERHV